MAKELNLFIIWEKGRYLEDPILRDIAAKFKIIQVFNISWPHWEFAHNLAKFYGKNLPKGCRKQKECGSGAFMFIVVEDENPQYEAGQNINMTHCKGLYRRWYQGHNLIHGSDCQQEGQENLQMLLGLNEQEFYQLYGSKTWNGNVIDFGDKNSQTVSGNLRVWLQNWGRQLAQNLNLW